MSTYLNNTNTVRLAYNRDNYEMTAGWAEIAEYLDWIKENAERDLSKVNVSKENPFIKITGKTAWALCDNIWEGEWEEEKVYMTNLQITFLEKVKGEWKISFVTWLPKPEGEAGLNDIVKNNSMVANWNVSLNPDVSKEEFEDFLLEEFIPAYEKHYAGIGLLLLKSDRGTDEGNYSILLHFDSIEERNEWWPAEGESSDKSREASNKMKDLNEKLQSMVTMSSWNDWLVLK